MIRKIGAALAIAAGALAAAGVAAPANANVAGNYLIESGDLVVWRDANYTGPAFDFDSTNLTQYNQADSYNQASGAFRTPIANTNPVQYTYTHVDNEVSSIANYDIVDYVRAWTEASYTGTYFQILPYGIVNGTLNWCYSSLGTFDNKVTSHQIAGSPTP